jgi:hypothetical protein
MAADSLDEWAPNVGVQALSIAATILIVEHIIRREARHRGIIRRLRRRRDDEDRGERNPRPWRVAVGAEPGPKTHAARPAKND